MNLCCPVPRARMSGLAFASAASYPVGDDVQTAA
jgi:hypothetical protein